MKKQPFRMRMMKAMRSCVAVLSVVIGMAMLRRNSHFV